MTHPANDAWLNAALDRFTVPPPSDNFAARVTAAALAQSDAPASAVSQSRSHHRRGKWVRTRHVVMGVGAFSLMSATAAAAGLFGDMNVRIPVISALVESVAHVTKKTPKPPQMVAKPLPTPAKVKPAEAPLMPVVIVPDMPPPEALIVTPEQRRAAHADRVADRLEGQMARRDARRAALGLPLRPDPRQITVERLRAAQSDDERRAIFQELRANAEKRRALRAQRLGIEPGPQLQSRSSPDARRALRDMRRKKREAKLEQLKRLKDVDPATLRDVTTEQHLTPND
jgi:hypothetical protein